MRMLRLVLGAIRRRRAQALLLFLLGTIAATVAAAAPGYIATGVQSLAAASVEAAVPAERVIAVDWLANFDQSSQKPTDMAASFRQNVASAMKLPGFRSVVDVRGAGSVVKDATGNIGVALAYRDGVCDQVAIVGRCPSAPGEVLLSAAAAAQLGTVGDTVRFFIEDVAHAVTLRVTGTYSPRAPYDPYWGRSTATPSDPAPGARLTPYLLLTPLSTFDSLAFPLATISADVIATGDAFRHTDAQVLIGVERDGGLALSRQSYRTTAGLQALTNRIFDDQQLVYVAVPVGVVELLLLCWFALFLAVRQTGEERRLDVAKLKLHGSRRRDMWVLVAGQSVLPVLIGGVVGVPAGVALARLLGGPVSGDSLSRLMLYAAVAAAAVAVLGGIVAALVAERRILGESVADLGREVASGGTGRRSRLRSGLFDISIAALAIAATYQLTTGGLATTRLRGLAVAAPLLLALIAGLLTSRLVPLAARAVGPGLLRAGRVGSWLVAAHLHRRAGRSRVLALLTLAVAVLASTALAFGVAAPARANRAAYEVGADRVLTVDAPNRDTLLAAVRAADPDGRFAMAAVQTYGTVRVLAVDTSRLSAVVPWQDAYGGGSWDDLVGALRQPHPDPVAFTGTSLRLTATWQPVAPAGSPVMVAAVVVTRAGDLATVRFGPLRPGRADYTAATPFCAEGPCRLVSVGLAPTGSNAVPPAAGSRLVLSELDQADPAAPVVSTAMFADRTRWRNDVRPNFAFGQLTTDDAGLAFAVPTPDESGQPKPAIPDPAYVYDSPVPLPMVVIGADTKVGPVDDPALLVFGDTAAPVTPVAQARSLPRLGTSGVLVDLAEADRVLPVGSTVGTMEVWLSAAAPPDIVERLGAAGVRVISVDSRADRLAQLSAEGTAVAQRFQLLVGLAGVALALFSFAAWAAAERTLRGRELLALRRQGLTVKATRTAAAGGYLALVAVGVLVGCAVGLTLRTVDSGTVFQDGFVALPDPPVDPTVALVSIGAAAVALVVAALLAGRAVRRRSVDSVHSSSVRSSSVRSSMVHSSSLHSGASR
jgi:hypothetical protein